MASLRNLALACALAVACWSAFGVRRPGAGEGRQMRLESPGVAPAPGTSPVAPTRVLPVAFVPNLGQWRDGSRFVARSAGVALHAFADSFGVVFAGHGGRRPDAPLTRVSGPRMPQRAPTARPAHDDAMAMSTVRDFGLYPPPLAAAALRFTFEGAAHAPRLEGRQPLPARFHYFLGDDPARWRAGVVGFRRVHYQGLYEGIDLVLRGGGSEAFEYDLHLAPGARVDDVVVRVDGAIEGATAPLRIDDDGALVVATRLGDVRQPRPRAWQETARGIEDVDCAFEIVDPSRFRFRIHARADGAPLVIDPQVQVSTYLGGNAWDEVFALAVDGDDVVLAGRTFSADFPVRGAFQSLLHGTVDAFVARLPLSGAPLVHATYLGGGGDDEARALALDANGNAVLAGSTRSSDFPVRRAFQPALAGAADAFVARLSASGDRLLDATYFGGSGVDGAVSLALDTSGAVVVAGGTASSDFPTASAFQPRSAGGFDAFVARLVLGGAPPVCATFLGGRADDGAVSLALDAQGAAVVTGWTASSDFPTRNAFQATLGGGTDAFVTRLLLDGAQPSCSTHLGGSADDFAFAVALDASGNAVVAGGTSSPDFPTRGAFQANLAGPSDAFVTRLPLTGQPPSASTYFGGTSTDTILALALDRDGAAVVAGWTFSVDLPTRDALQPRSAGGADAFLTRLPASGATPVYASYLGGSGLDKPYALAVDEARAAVVVGLTDSADFPTRNALQPRPAGYFDVFATRLDLLPAGASTFGRSTHGCAGALPIGARSSPRVGNATFELTCGHAPANTAGLLALGSAALTAPVVVLGAAVWLDPAASAFTMVSVSSTAGGEAALPLPIPPHAALAGASVFGQFFWPDACAAGGLSASNALQVVVQP